MPDHVTSRPLNSLFAFLQQHHHWNLELQRRESFQALAPFPGTDDAAKRLFSVLHGIANTQSQPKMEALGRFWRQLHKFTSQDPAPTRLAFTEHLEKAVNQSPKGKGPWERLFNALRAQSGWGDKTSALFVKTALRIHSDPTLLHFWNDTDDGAIDPQDRLYVPVDAVISVIFDELGVVAKPDFKKINSFLADHYLPREMLIWDDLWFWGFFTQEVREKTRVLGWNSDKFWCTRSSPFTDEHKVKVLAAEFLQILRNPTGRSVPS
jgi:hypothetical protein